MYMHQAIRQDTFCMKRHSHYLIITARSAEAISESRVNIACAQSTTIKIIVRSTTSRIYLKPSPLMPEGICVDEEHYHAFSAYTVDRKDMSISQVLYLSNLHLLYNTVYGTMSLV